MDNKRTEICTVEAQQICLRAIGGWRRSKGNKKHCRREIDQIGRRIRRLVAIVV
jgi:hypothetical protein